MQNETPHTSKYTEKGKKSEWASWILKQTIEYSLYIYIFFFSCTQYNTGNCCSHELAWGHLKCQGRTCPTSTTDCGRFSFKLCRFCVAREEGETEPLHWVGAPTYGMKHNPLIVGGSRDCTQSMRIVEGAFVHLDRRDPNHIFMVYYVHWSPGGK